MVKESGHTKEENFGSLTFETILVYMKLDQRRTLKRDTGFRIEKSAVAKSTAVEIVDEFFKCIT